MGLGEEPVGGHGWQRLRERWGPGLPRGPRLHAASLPRPVAAVTILVATPPALPLTQPQVWSAFSQRLAEPAELRAERPPPLDFRRGVAASGPALGRRGGF